VSSLAGSLLEDLRTFSGGMAWSDDIAVCAVEVLG